MKNRKLIDAFQYVDDAFLDLPEKKKKSTKPRLLRWGAFAACLCLVVTGTVFALSHKGRVPPLDPFNDVTEEDLITEQKTSDTYDSLEDLLLYLSRHDSHSSAAAEDGNGSRDITGSGLSEGEEHILYGDYIYRLNTEDQWLIEILRMEEDNLEPAGAIEIPAVKLFLTSDRLFALSEEYSGDELEYETFTKVSVYDLSSPAKPALLKTYTQSGSLSACYMVGQELFFLTSDGVCACGWSRLSDTAGYVPTLRADKKEIPWAEDEISILGDPTSIQYTAVTGLDTGSLEIRTKHAYYGDIYKVFYGENWLAFTTSTGGSTYYTQPWVYTFDTKDGLAFTGKLSSADLLGLNERIKTTDGHFPDGTYASIVSVMKTGNEYRMVGTVGTNGKTQKTELLSVAAIMETGSCIFQTFPLEDYPYAGFDEILWEEDRVILSISTMHDVGADIYTDNHFLLVEFSDTEMSLYESDLVFDHVAGVDMMYTYGSPFGELESLIPLGDGIYLRYNDKPDGLDIYDFSDSQNPRLLYESDGDLPEGARFEFQNTVYTDGTFGILTVYPNSQGEYYQNTTLNWRIYAVDSSDTESPLTLLREIPAGSSEYYKLQKETTF